jgi:hypothetical protein
MNPVTIAKIGAVALPLVASMFQRGGRKKVDWGSIERWLGGIRPSGYLTDADYAAAETTRSRLARDATTSAALLRTEAMRRARQRGLGTAPALETTLARIGEAEARGRQSAGESAEEQLYSVRLGNQRFEQEKALALIGSRIQDVIGGRAAGDARQAAFWNSVIDYAPAALDALGRMSPGTRAAVRRFNPSSGRLEIIDSPLTEDSPDRLYG